MTRPGSFAVLLCGLPAIGFVLATPESAAAWCQSLNVQEPSASCAQRCLALDDFDASEIASRGIVDLEWNRSCIGMSYYPAGARFFDIPTARRIIAESAAVWSDLRCGSRQPFSLVLTEEPSQCGEPQTLFGRGNVNTIAWVSEGWETERGYDPDALAVTLTWSRSDTGEILDADMLLNQEHWSWAECPAAAGCTDGRVDLANTLVHEMGHVLGLAHTPEDRLATMWACAPPGQTLKRDLTDDDIDGICAIYPESDASVDCDYTPNGGFDPSCGTNEGCYCSAPPHAGPSLGATWYGIFLAIGALLAWRHRVAIF